MYTHVRGLFEMLCAFYTAQRNNALRDFVDDDTLANVSGYGRRKGYYKKK